MIYLDHAATTPLDDEVLEAMLPHLRGGFGNPSSVYALGRGARAALDQARDTIAVALGCESRELIFTSGGSEADNLAVRGVALANHDRGRHLICSQVEHHAVLHPCQELEANGFDVTYLPVDAHGRVDPEQLRAALRPDTTLVSIMAANNEVGTVEPVRELADITRGNSQAYFHTDAVQAFGKVPVRADELGVDLLTITAHKIHGPKGSGALFARTGIPLAPQITGGGHERNRRAGTENVAGIVGLAKAVAIAVRDFERDTSHMRTLQSLLVEAITTAVPDARLTGHPTERVPHNASFLIPDVEGDSLLMLLDRGEVYASSGSACTSGSLEASHVLLAMGISQADALGSLRLTLGKRTTAAEIEQAVDMIRRAVEQLRSRRPGAVS